MMKDKEDFLGFSDLKDNQKKDLKILLDQGVHIREVNYKKTAIWEHYYLAEYKGVGIEFDFSDGADRKDKNWIARSAWEKIQNEIASRK